MIFGDFAFSLRSALDHIAVAIAPAKRKRDASFPIVNKPIFERDPVTRRVDPKYRSDRKKLARRTPTSMETLDGLNRLRNADTHRSLAVLATGLITWKVERSEGTCRHPRHR